MNIKFLIFMLLCAASSLGNAQASAVGFSVAALDYESTLGTQVGFKLRCQIHKKLYWNAGTNYVTLNDKTTEKIITTNGFGSTTEITRTTQSEYFHAYSGLEYPALAFGKVIFFTGIEWGCIKDADDYYANLQGEISLETNITNEICVAFPITYSFITWKKDKVATLGVRVSYLY